VSHQPQRTENDCLNCGTLVAGRFCQNCGQENIVTHQGFLALTRHFIYDIFHFDGKFFETLWLMFRRPGRVAHEYVKGRRVNYLDPIRMYLFTSAIFFLLFSTVLGKTSATSDDETYHPITNTERAHFIDSLEKRSAQDSLNPGLRKKIALLKSSQDVTRADLKAFNYYSVNQDGRRYNSLEQFDSIQNSLPDSSRANWVQRLAIKKYFSIRDKSNGRMVNVTEAIKEDFIHRLPMLVFISLPLCALILKLLYRRRRFYYSDHAVFTLYQYIAGFILMLLMFTVGRLEEKSGWDVFNWLLAILFAYGGFHLLRSMKTFYAQGWSKTILKFVLLNFIGFWLILLLFVLFITLSIIEF
jgi:hypothetical protein